MVGALWFLLAVGATGLHVQTDTPDALCPPLESVREAVRSRLGEVEGGPYEARFGVVRGGNEEPDSLVLTLTGAEGAELLRREFPLSSLSCTDAADVIALVLERFFQQMSAVEPEPASDDAAASSEASTAPAGSTARASEPAPEPPSSPPPPARPSEAGRPDEERAALTGGGWDLRGQGGAHTSLTSSAGVGAAFQVPSPLGGLRGQVVLDALWPLSSRRVQEQDLSLALQSSWFFASGLLLAETGRWSWGAGPLVGLELEQAEIEGAPQLSDGVKRRLLLGLGAHAVGRYALSAPVQLELGLRGLPMLTGATRRFAVRDAGGAELEVLRPEGLEWAVTIGLNLRVGGGS